MPPLVAEYGFEEAVDARYDYRGVLAFVEVVDAAGPEWDVVEDACLAFGVVLSR